MKKIEIMVKTCIDNGKFQHEVHETGITTNTRHKYAISKELVDFQKLINEMVYNRLPEGSKNIVINKIEYRVKTK